MLAPESGEETAAAGGGGDEGPVVDGPVTKQAGLGFGGLLRRLRAEARLTQEELAEAARVSQRAVSDLERGINATARKDTALLLAGALGLGRAGARTVRRRGPRAGSGQRRAGRHAQKAAGDIRGGGAGAAEQPSRPARGIHRPGPRAVRSPDPGEILPPGHLDRDRGMRQTTDGACELAGGLLDGSGDGVGWWSSRRSPARTPWARPSARRWGSLPSRAGPGGLAGCAGPPGHADRAR